MPQLKISKSTPSKWLLGTWRSDKKRTLENYRHPRKGGAGFKRFLEKDLGKLTHRYTRKRRYTHFGTIDLVDPYRIVWEGEDDLFIVHGRPGDESGWHITFTSPKEFRARMGKGGDEYFKKVQSVA
jgi:hypothetical protein